MRLSDTWNKTVISINWWIFLPAVFENAVNKKNTVQFLISRLLLSVVWLGKQMALFTFHDPTVRNTSHDFGETRSLVKKFQFAIGKVGILKAEAPAVRTSSYISKILMLSPPSPLPGSHSSCTHPLGVDKVHLFVSPSKQNPWKPPCHHLPLYVLPDKYVSSCTVLSAVSYSPCLWSSLSPTVMSPREESTQINTSTRLSSHRSMHTLFFSHRCITGSEVCPFGTTLYYICKNSMSSPTPQITAANCGKTPCGKLSSQKQ